MESRSDHGPPSLRHAWDCGITEAERKQSCHGERFCVPCQGCWRFWGTPSVVCFNFVVIFTCITEAERKWNGSRTEAHMICCHDLRRAFLFRLHNRSRTEAERKLDGSKICFACITEAERKRNGSNKNIFRNRGGWGWGGGYLIRHIGPYIGPYRAL